MGCGVSHSLSCIGRFRDSSSFFLPIQSLRSILLTTSISEHAWRCIIVALHTLVVFALHTASNIRACVALHNSGVAYNRRVARTQLGIESHVPEAPHLGLLIGTYTLTQRDIGSSVHQSAAAYTFTSRHSLSRTGTVTHGPTYLLAHTQTHA